MVGDAFTDVVSELSHKRKVPPGKKVVASIRLKVMDKDEDTDHCKVKITAEFPEHGFNHMEPKPPPGVIHMGYVMGEPKLSQII